MGKLFVINYWLSALLLLVLFTKCDSSNSVNNHIISPNKMAAIIADLKIIDAVKQSGIYPLSLQDSLQFIDSNKNDLNKPISRKELRRKKLLQAEIKQAKEDIENSYAIENESINNDSILSYVPEKSKTNHTETPKIFIPHLGAEYEVVFIKHGITRKQFEEALSTYGKEPKVFFAICEEALNILNLQYAFLEQNLTKEQTQ